MGRLALDWVARDGPTVLAEATAAVEVPVPVAAGLVTAWLEAGEPSVIVATRRDGVARWAWFNPSEDGLPARMVLAESGQHLEETLDQVFDGLIALGRRRDSDTVWAFADVVVQRQCGRWLNVARPRRWQRTRDHILDVHPWQRLGPGHLARLGRLVDDGAEVARRRPGRVAAVSYGPPRRPQFAIVRRLRDELGPALLSSTSRAPSPTSPSGEPSPTKTFPRRIRSWYQATEAAHDADGRGFRAWDHVRDAAAEALMGTAAETGLWAAVAARIAEQAPARWETFDRELRLHLGQEVDAAFASADEYLSTQAEERRVIAALSGVCGAALALSTYVVMAHPGVE